jgi:NitT/TauT family transport system substrate-binding protein
MNGKIWLRIAPIFASVGLVAALLLGGGSVARAETTRVRVATQLGLAYLPLVVMEHDHLWEKQADAAGVRIHVEYTRLGGAAGLNDALLSDSVELAAGGIAPMLLLWDRTASTSHVTGVAALNASPVDVLTNRPGIKSLADFTAEDRIAVPAIKTSIQAIVLMAAAEKTFGRGQANRLDTLTVTMQHPDALTALMAHSSQITGYVSSSPFQDIALKTPGISKLTDSFAVFGGPTTLGVVYAKRQFAADNPIVMGSFYAALREAITLIAYRPGTAIDQYLKVTQEKTSRALLEEIITHPDFKFGLEPIGTLAVAQIMQHFGFLKQTPTSWKDYFAEPLYAGQGS